MNQEETQETQLMGALGEIRVMGVRSQKDMQGRNNANRAYKLKEEV